MDKAGWFERVYTDQEDPENKNFRMYQHKQSGSMAVIGDVKRIGSDALSAIGGYMPLLLWFESTKEKPKSLWINNVHMDSQQIDGELKPSAVCGTIDLGGDPKRIVINDDRASLLIVVRDEKNEREPSVLTLASCAEKTRFSLPSTIVDLGWSYPEEDKPHTLWDGWLYKATRGHFDLDTAQTLLVERTLPDPDSTGKHHIGLLEVSRGEAGFEALERAVEKVARLKIWSLSRPRLCPISAVMEEVTSHKIIADPVLVTAMNAYKVKRLEDLCVSASAIIESQSNTLPKLSERWGRAQKLHTNGLLPKL